MPLVSVIMPSFNHEKFIAESIESVLNQTIKDIELIIIDDASKDTSRQIINEYRINDNRIKVVFHESNMGIAKTLNQGLDIAIGKYVAFTASDDIWISDKLEKQIQILKENEDLVVWTSVYIIDTRGNFTGSIMPNNKLKRRIKNILLKNNNYIFHDLMNGNVFIGSTLMLKKQNINNILFSEKLKYINDYFFCIELSYRYKYYFIDEPLAKYRVHDNNTSRKDNGGWVDDFIKLKDIMLEEYGQSMNNLDKANLFRTIAVYCFNMGNKQKAKEWAYQAFKYNKSYLPILIMVHLKRDNLLLKLLRKG